ncbi:interleukin-17C [Narcine bancroftii]|uniref:interleukin-17C n=1 Tax=Narcine bancroftii TaxID=1343680 RepID=UPI0038321811
MRHLQVLPIVLLSLGFAQTRRSEVMGSHQCFSPEELELEAPVKGLQKLVLRASKENFALANLVKHLEQQPQRAGRCPKLGHHSHSQHNTDISRRSLSPWEYRIDKDETRIPSKLAFAHCLCEGCIDAETGEETRALNSVRLERSMLVLKRHVCPGKAGHYCFEPKYIKVPMACTCVLPRSRQELPAESGAA